MARRRAGSQRLSWLAVVWLPLLVAACSTDKVWENSDVPRDQWARDRATCQDQAQVQAERDFTLDQQANRSLPRNQAAPWTGQMDRFSAQQRQTQLFNACMARLGYKQVQASEAPETSDQPAGTSGAPPK